MFKPTNFFELNPKVFSIYLENQSLYKIKSLIESNLSDLDEVCVCYSTLTLFFKNPKKLDNVIRKVNQLSDNYEEDLNPSKLWEMPICFDENFDNDLAIIFHNDKRKISLFRNEFLSHNYQLEFYGFLPGFGYLSGLPTELHLPRKTAPAKQIQKGSVAIGGAQLGVYPWQSPGGWNCIGNCPVPWIDLKNLPYIFINPDDQIKFVEIALNEYKQIINALKTGAFTPQSSLL